MSATAATALSPSAAIAFQHDLFHHVLQRGQLPSIDQLPHMNEPTKTSKTGIQRTVHVDGTDVRVVRMVHVGVHSKQTFENVLNGPVKVGLGVRGGCRRSGRRRSGGGGRRHRKQVCVFNLFLNPFQQQPNVFRSRQFDGGGDDVAVRPFVRVPRSGGHAGTGRDRALLGHGAVNDGNLIEKIQHMGRNPIFSRDGLWAGAGNRRERRHMHARFQGHVSRMCSAQGDLT